LSFGSAFQLKIDIEAGFFTIPFPIPGELGDEINDDGSNKEKSSLNYQEISLWHIYHDRQILCKTGRKTCCFIRRIYSNNAQ